MPRCLFWLALLFAAAAPANDFDAAERASTRGDYDTAVQIYTTLIDADNADAMVRLAALYQRGEGVARDLDKAAELYLQASDLGNAEAQFNLGNMYLLGEGVAQDPDWALTFYRLAARQGHELAARNMLELYRAAGIEPQENAATGAPLTEEELNRAPEPEQPLADLEPVSAADIVVVEAQPEPAAVAVDSDERAAIRLAQEHGIAVEIEGGDNERAHADAVDAVTAGVATGAEAVDVSPHAFQPGDWADALASGDYETAVPVLAARARSGDGDAALILSRLSSDGAGMTRDDEAAVVWLQMAADAGNADAQFELANRYMLGRGVVPDDAMAITLYRDAIGNGHLAAQGELREIYTAAGIPMPDLTRPGEPLPIYRSVGMPIEVQPPAGEAAKDVAPRRVRTTIQMGPSAATEALEQEDLELETEAAAGTETTLRQTPSQEPVTAEGDASAVTMDAEAEPPSVPRTPEPVPIVLSEIDPILARTGPAIEPQKPRNHLVVPGSMLAQGLERPTPAAEPSPVDAGDTGTSIPMATATMVAQESEKRGLFSRLKRFFADHRSVSVIEPIPDSETSEPVATASVDAARAALAAGRFEQAAASFHHLAAAGNAEAQAHLGYMYYRGEGVPVDLRAAIDWYTRAAVQGNRDAQYNLAVAYTFGEGVEQDDDQAAVWYRRAAEQGSAIAQYSLGVSFALGEGIEPDEVAAAKWYRAAAEQGYPVAQYNLGYCYRAGQGVAQDDGEALKWFAAAALNGHASAQHALGYMYRSGKGVGRDLDEAKKWYSLAAQQGHPDARADLASLTAASF